MEPNIPSMQLIIGLTLLSVIGYCSLVNSGSIESETKNSLIEFHKNINNLSEYEENFVTNLIGQLILDQIYDDLGRTAPTRFKNADLMNLNLSEEDAIAADAVRNAAQDFFEIIIWPFNLSKDDYKNFVMEPCQSIVSKLAESAKVYRSSNDKALLFGLKYYEVCKTIVEAKRLESRVVGPEKATKKTMR